MADPKKPDVPILHSGAVAPQTPTQYAASNQGGHKNAAVGPTTSKPLRDWKMTRDYENFNPTPEK